MAYFKKITETGEIISGRYRFWGFLIGTDGTNDPTVTIEDRDSKKNSGEVVPTNVYDASAYGLNGVMLSEPIECNHGIYVTIACDGDVEVTVYYS